MRALACLCVAALSALAGCARTAAHEGAPDASPPSPSESELPTTRVGVLTRYMDASILNGLSQSLARTGLSPCAQAYITSSGGPTPDAAVRDAYFAMCTSLPMQVQKCLAIIYASNHPDECEALSRGFDAAMREKVDQLQALRPTTR